MQKRWLSLVVLLLVAAVFFAWKPPSPNSEPSSSDLTNKPSKSNSSLSGGPISASSKSSNILITPISTLEASPNFPHPGTHTTAELGNFYLPEISLESASLFEAVQALLQAYADVSNHTNQTPLNFQITLPEGIDRLQDFHLRNRSFKSALYTIAAAYKTSFEVSDTSLAFTKISDLETSSSDPKITRQWTLPFNYDHTLQQLFSTNDISDSQLPLPATKATSEPPPSLQDLVRYLGIPFSEANKQRLESSTRSPNNLVISATASQLARLDQLIDSVFLTPPIQHRFETTLITSSDNLDIQPGYHLPTEIDTQLERIQSTNGTNLATTPHILNRTGETATLELVHSEISKTPSGQTIEDLTGLAITTHSNPYGFGYQPQIEILSLPPNTPNNLPPVATMLGEQELNQSDVAPGAHALVSHQTTPDGQHQYVITRISQLDATGSPISERKSQSP